MDAVTFATPILIRKMAFANAAKSEVQTVNYAKAVSGLGLTHDQFVDLCILMGCDYCDTIKGMGPKTALKLIREHGTIEKIIEVIKDQVTGTKDKHKKYEIPPDWLPHAKKEQDSEGEDEEMEEEEEEFIPVYVQARRLFNEHEVLSDVELKWKPCQPEALTKFLVDEQGFNADRVKKQIEKLQAAYKKNQKPQMRMDNFFAVKPSAPKAKPAAAAKGKTVAAKGKKTLAKKR